jgi:hypothetical protein
LSISACILSKRLFSLTVSSLPAVSVSRASFSLFFSAIIRVSAATMDLAFSN